ncbi:hypothetical protein BCR37DRAFT_394661 [Protomyces lactucae-debilis]|uniref:DUF202 domain-containing protein n=1 Tax=Protomyces lactucae-debilis TaxID=2754530 RepID=A0A1Y2F2S9_PROLT|nr:uncharacterized protein BCR37DRAFT_394661 [Protomyces lactucae-debilis]ORY78153.1 hypothetical protein BCR37DRAFT_394661 [Protomyces lactucae-debilis]
MDIPVLTSEVRDHLANERTFLSALKMSLSLALVSFVCFLDVRLNRTSAAALDGDTSLSQAHTPHRPMVHDRSKLTSLLAFGFLFMSLLSMFSACLNYFRTQNRYIKHIGIVRDHWFVNASIAMVGVGMLLANGLLLFEERNDPRGLT